MNRKTDVVKENDGKIRIEVRRDDKRKKCEMDRRKEENKGGGRRKCGGIRRKGVEGGCSVRIKYEGNGRTK